MFMKTLTAGVLAVSLSLTMLTAPTRAQASFSEEDAVIGIITLLLIGAAIHNSRDDDKDETPPVDPNAWRILPDTCLVRDVRRNGDVIRFFDQTCMSTSYAYRSHLPDRCQVQFISFRGQHRVGWRARCLRETGFRFNRY